MIRLTSILLENFKNTEYGRIVLSPQKSGNKRWKSDIVGLYGQNGSGKTSVVAAFFVLKSLLLGEPLPNIASECIPIGKNSSTIKVTGVFQMEIHSESEGEFSYQMTFGRNPDGKLGVRSERLSVKIDGDEINHDLHSVFGYDYAGDSKAHAELEPKIAWKSLANVNREIATELAVAMRIAVEESGSPLFSQHMHRVINSYLEIYNGELENETKLSNAAKRAMERIITPLSIMFLQLRQFAIRDFAVLPPAYQAKPTFNVLNLATHEGDLGEMADTAIGLDLNSPITTSADMLNNIEATIRTVNGVLGALVPALSIGVQKLGIVMLDDGEIGERIELVATRNGATVPLRCESEGIKKLISILILLIDVYAKPGSCVVIDELDSGIFEYLLGEILQVLQDHGRGQLIFTAHNLRPLEVIGNDKIILTTTNPKNRFTKFKGLRATNNARDQYLRAIDIGGQDEAIYEPTSKYEIDSAFYDAFEMLQERRGHRI